MTQSTASPRSVSVALGTYRSAEFIEAQLLSILDQSVPVDEVVVSDDGSPDDTLATIARIAARHPRGHVVRILEGGRAGGVVKNFERAIRTCKGEFIALSDHDDVWLPHKIAALLDAIGTNDLVFSNAYIIDGAGKRTGDTLFASYGVTEIELSEIEAGQGVTTLHRRNIVTGATVLVRRSLAQAALPVGTSWVHDEWLAFLAAAKGGLAVLREPVMEYRVHGGNQIGVPRSGRVRTFLHSLRAGYPRYKMHRDRTLALLRAASRLHVPAEVDQGIRDHLAFDIARLLYPQFPWNRGPAVRRQWALGSYERFTWPAKREAWRDRLQRP